MPPPGAVVTARRMQVDPRTEALYGERVPYIISRGMDGPKAKQATRALTPEEFVSDRYDICIAGLAVPSKLAVLQGERTRRGSLHWPNSKSAQPSVQPCRR